jgi:hypothetical protein
MRKFVVGGLSLAALVLVLVPGWLGAGHGSPLALSVETIRPGVTCPTQPDTGAYKLDRWKVVDALLYKRDAALAPGVDAAFGTWAGEAGLIVTPDGDTSTPSVAFDGTNNVFKGPLGGNTIAATYVWYDRRTREVAEFDMVFNNNNLTWANLTGDPDTQDCVPGETSFDIQDIAAHEFGHVLGIAHTSPNGANNAQTLYPYGQAGELYKRSLADGDKAGVAAKYP